MRTKFHERLETARKRRRVTQQAIADHLSVGQSAVSHWCTGRSEPDRETTSSLADFLGVRAAWLLIGDGTMVDDAPASPSPTRPRKSPSPKRAAPRPQKARTKHIPADLAARRRAPKAAA